MGGVHGFRARDEVGHLAKSVDHHKDAIQLTPSPGYAQDEVEADLLPGRIGDRKWEVLPHISFHQFANGAGGAAANHLANIAT